ncbi:2-amino-4-hydroxy-6-hydroxymethyldihydropteridine diphosphokinase [Pseudoponticoccus marisrubri]|uniref:2-amino-4-hydroxy-6-hydroxymethyldihydropteridine pyrophosphokinase n=1 Tax=Pseudoponticoccus marisrubri TaxID=1685382 RepID=A0A0W7WK88_9RHOB|nr:2-amino-4-hydroxy-6-hydroxymethyldihydropteridine diphosphokinase [Pseudoponticoccus marisrubri]KUF11029.1 2-amino-4-hydroxy-6-hydroxymethyldihydropteridine pyrophosphokinase [Pseudoponticoccus marisrubri]
MVQEFLIALGSNLGSQAGDPAATLSTALVELRNRDVRLRRVSRFFRTPCFPTGAGPDYVNACAAVGAACSPARLLEILHDVEAGLGRARQVRWGSRTLDLDLLAAGPQVLPDVQTQAEWRELPLDAQRSATPGQLVLPHPRLQDRAFVLVPLADIAPGWVHPLLRQDVASLLAHLPAEQRASAVPLPGIAL